MNLQRGVTNTFKKSTRQVLIVSSTYRSLHFCILTFPTWFGVEDYYFVYDMCQEQKCRRILMTRIY